MTEIFIGIVFGLMGFTFMAVIVWGVYEILEYGFNIHVSDILKAVKKYFKRRTPLQKEIHEEERLIKEIEAHKADMERLEALRRRRERLFEDIGEDKYQVDIIPKYIKCTWCGNYIPNGYRHFCTESKN